jgi:CRISPR-associated protein Csb3
MAEARIPVDLLNPGQVFACIGLVEAAEILLGHARGAFLCNPDSTQGEFSLLAAGNENPVEAVIQFLKTADISSIAYSDSKHTTEKWEIITKNNACALSIPDPDSPATLIARMHINDKTIELDYWGDDTGRDTVKFWAGSGGYPGAALLRDAQKLLINACANIHSDPFNFSACQKSSFRFDLRRDYTALDAGFSPNDHADIIMAGYPLVEILAAIGMTHTRPWRGDWKNKLAYSYWVILLADQNAATGLPVLRSALGSPNYPVSRRKFNITLDWPGKEGQARRIRTVSEEKMT